MDIAITKMRKNIDIYEYQDHLPYLKDVYKQMRSTRKSYTISDFSEDLGFGNNNTMAQIHSGHRKLSKKASERIASLLKLDKMERQYFGTLVEVKSTKSVAAREEKLALLLELRGRQKTENNEASPLNFFNSWHHAVVFELLDVVKPQSIGNIQARFSMQLSESDIKKSLELLASINLVEISGENSEYYRKTQWDFSLGGAVPGMAIARYHQEMINLAKESLIETPPSQRDISSVTISVGENTLNRIKQDINLFRRYLLFLASETEESDKVMQVNIQFFPLSK